MAKPLIKPVLLLSVFIGACDTIKSSKSALPLAQLGINIAELEIVQQTAHWHSTDRNNVTRVFHSLRDGMAAHLGFDPFIVPAEYLAALIVCYVKPINYHAACAWLSSISRSTHDLAQGCESEPVKPSQLFALIHLAAGQDKKFASRFQSRIQNAEETAAAQNGTDNKNPKQPNAK